MHDTVAAIEAAGGIAIPVPADLAKPEEVETIVARAKAAPGPIDLLINNAALTVPGRPPAAGRLRPAGRLGPAAGCSRRGRRGRGGRRGRRGGRGQRAHRGGGSAGDSTRPASQSPPAVPGPSAIRRHSFLDFPLKGFRLHFEIGLMATYRLMQLALPDMIDAGRGSIVKTSAPSPLSFPARGPTRRRRRRRCSDTAATKRPCIT